MWLRRTTTTVLVALTAATGVAACGGERSTREGNPEVEDQRLDQRRPPAETQAPTSDY